MTPYREATMHDGHLAGLGFGHPQHTTNLDEFQVWEIEEAFRKALENHEQVNEMFSRFFACLDPYSEEHWKKRPGEAK